MGDLLAAYASGGAGPFDSGAGQKLFTATHSAAKEPRKRSCTQCHTRDLSAPGKHLRTGKRIAPMAPSVNPKRFTDSHKIRKWLRRNCKWTLGRTCSPQEKGDLLTFFKSQ